MAHIPHLGGLRRLEARKEGELADTPIHHKWISRKNAYCHSFLCGAVEIATDKRI
jgi:hypothetical protein